MEENKVIKYDVRYQLLAAYIHPRDYNDKLIEELINSGGINYQIPSKRRFFYRQEILFGCTALHIAIKNRDYLNFKVLIENHADYTIKNCNGETPVHLIVKELYRRPENAIELRKFLDIVLAAHMKFKNKSNPRSDKGISHFHAACIRSRAKLMKLFLKNEAFINEAVDIESEAFAGYTTMHFVAHFSCFSAAKLLLNRDVDMTRKDARGLTPLDLLIERNMKIADWVNMGKSKYCDSFKKEYERNEKIIVMILEKIKYRDITQLSNLHVACTLQDTSRLQLELLKKNVKLNEPVSENSTLWPGYTPAHFAAHFNVKSVKLLLDSGANFLIKNTEGLTPLDLFLERYEVQDLSSLLQSVTAWKDIGFAESKVSLCSALEAMEDEDTFGNFLKSLSNINMSIPSKSPIFSGYTLLHLVVALSERNQHKPEERGFHDLANRNVEVLKGCYIEDVKMCHSRIQMCVNLGADVAVANSNGSSPLHLAFKLHRDIAVNMLLNSYKGRDFINEDNLSHLHVACAAGNETLVKDLISKSTVHVNQAVTTSYKIWGSFLSAKSTPLSMAIISRNEEIVKLLLSQNADIYARDSNGLTALHQLFIKQKSKLVDSRLTKIANLLLSSEDFKECETSFGLSHLHVASYSNNGSAIEKLLANGANIDALISFKSSTLHSELQFLKDLNTFTPLHLAIKYECDNAVLALIRLGASLFSMPPQITKKLQGRHVSDTVAFTLIKELVSRKDFQKLGLTELHAACATLDIRRASQLLNEGADPNAQVHMDSPIWPGNTSLHFTLITRKNYPMNDIYEIIDLLLIHKADVTLTNLENDSPFHYASFLEILTRPDFEFPENLFHAHTDFTVNPINNVGLSHFHIGCLHNGTDLVKNFLKHDKIDVNQTVDCASILYPGDAGIHMAARKKSHEIVDLLLNHNVNLFQRNRNYRMPIHEAAYFYKNISNLSEQTILGLVSTGEGLHSTTFTGETPLEALLRSKKPTTDTFRLFLKNENRVNIFNPSLGEGYIAMAISNDRNVEELLQNPYYAAIIDAPQANGPDEMGRSPIHNVVSLTHSSKMPSPPIHVYVKAVEELIKVGFDIDQQDATGHTPLHAAARFQNSKGFAALLNLGCDINITNHDGKTPLFYVLDSFEKSSYGNRKTQTEILRVSLDLIEKMQESRIYVSRINSIYDAGIRTSLSKYCVTINDTKKERQAEKERLLKEYIDSCNCKLWNFVCEGRSVMSYPNLWPSEREVIDNFFQTNAARLRQDYPHFNGLLMLQYRKSQARVDLIKAARIILGFLLNLPDVCCDCILQYLNNEQLKTLIGK